MDSTCSLSEKLKRVIDRLRARGCVVRRVRDSHYRAQCPAHHDKQPSLTLTVRSDRVLVRCFAGCPTLNVLRALGLRMRDLFAGPPAKRSPSQIVAVHGYHDLHGVLLAEKVRFCPKAFAWRRPDPTAASGYRWRLDGLRLRVYRLPYLIDAQQVLVVEGEKAVDALVPLGFAATCSPGGAGDWSEHHAETLWRAGVDVIVVLPDNDDAGRKHAQRVVSLSAGYRSPLVEPADLPSPIPSCPGPETHDPEVAPLRVKLVSLPGLPPGGDIYDWLAAGHTGAELRRIIANTPDWTADGAARAKLSHSRALNRERQRRWRQRQRAHRQSEARTPKTARGFAVTRVRATARRDQGEISL